MTNVARSIFSLPEREAIVRTFTESFRAKLEPGEEFAVDGGAESGRIFVRLTIADKDRENVTTMEAAIEGDDEDIKVVVSARAAIVEFLHSMLDEYLREGRWPRPHLDWKEYAYERDTIFYRGSVVNEKLEAMADALLAAAEGGSDE